MHLMSPRTPKPPTCGRCLGSLLLKTLDSRNFFLRPLVLFLGSEEDEEDFDLSEVEWFVFRDGVEV
jgi:hypothetical protein